MTNILKIEKIGKHQTYDLEVDHPDHQFYLDNGVLTSNSHSVSYAIDSYYAAWLHTHYEKEWLSTILQSASSKPKELAKIISEIKALGYKFARVDVNYSGAEWAFSEDAQAFVPPLTSVKKIGETAAEEIIANRPFKSVKHLLYGNTEVWQPSKINKSVIEALCCIEALSSLEEFKTGAVKNHKMLLESLTSDKNYEKLRKGLYGLTPTQIKKKQKLGEIIKPCIDELLEQNELVSDWTREEKLAMYFDYTSSADAEILFPEEVLNKIRDKGVDPLHDIPSGSEGIGWFCLASVEMKTTKNGKTFARCKVIDNEFREAWVRVWGDLSSVTAYSLWIARAHHDPQWGFSTSMAKLKKIL